MRSVILKNIFRFAFRRWDKIPNDELKGYSIYIFLVGLLIGCLLFGLMKVLFKWSFNELIMILLIMGRIYLNFLKKLRRIK